MKLSEKLYQKNAFWKVLIVSYIAKIVWTFCPDKNTTLTANWTYLPSISVSPDDTTFVLGLHSSTNNSSSEGAVFLMNSSTFSKITEAVFPQFVERVTYSKDGKYIGVGFRGTGKVSILNATDLSQVRQLNTGMTNILCVDFSYDNQKILVGGTGTSLQLWDTATWNLNRTINTLTSDFRTCAYASDGKFVASTVNKTLTYDVTGSLTVIYNFGGNRMAAKPDGTKFVVIYNSSVTISEAEWTGIQNHIAAPDKMTACDYTPNGQQIVVAAKNRLILSYDSITRLHLSNFTPTLTNIADMKYAHNSPRLFFGEYKVNRIYGGNHSKDYPSSNCTQICGDSITSVYACDNEVNIPYDGCNNTCQIMDDFQCNVTSGVTVCSYNGSITLDSATLTLDTSSGNYILVLEIFPPLYAYQICSSAELLPIFDLNIGNILNVTYNQPTNQFTLQINQPSDMTTQQLLLTYQPSSSPRPEFSQGKVQNFAITPEGKVKDVTQNMTQNSTQNTTQNSTVNETQNATQNTTDNSTQNSTQNISNITIQLDTVISYYSPIQQKISGIITAWAYALTTFGWISVIVGFTMRRLAGIEAICVLQFSWLNVLYLNNSFILPFQSVYPLKFSSGYNHFILPQTMLQSQHSPFISQFNISSKTLINNFNIMMLTLIIPLILVIVALIRYKLFIKVIWAQTKQQSLASKQKKDQLLIQQQQMYKLQSQYNIFLQLLMTCIMLNMIHFTFASAFFFKNGQIHNILSFVIFIFSMLIILIGMFCFYNKPARFGYLKRSFKSKRLALNHIYLLNLNLLLAPLLLVLLPKYSWAPAIPICLLLVYILAYRPYRIFKENLRSAFNLIIMLSFVGFRMYAESKLNQVNEISTYLFEMGAMGGLSLVITLSFISSIYYWYDEHYLAKYGELGTLSNGRLRCKIIEELAISRVNKKMYKIQEYNIFKNILKETKSLKAQTNDLKAIFEKQWENYSSRMMKNQDEKMMEKNQYIHSSILQQVKMEGRIQKLSNDIANYAEQTADAISNSNNSKDRINLSVQQKCPSNQSLQLSKQKRLRVAARTILIEQNNFVNWKGAVQYLQKIKQRGLTQAYLEDYSQIDYYL